MHGKSRQREREALAMIRGVEPGPKTTPDASPTQKWTWDEPDDVTRTVYAKKPKERAACINGGPVDDDGDFANWICVKGRDAYELAPKIVRAVNANDALVAACKALYDIGVHRWRALPADSHEKKSLAAAHSAIADAS